MKTVAISASLAFAIAGHGSLAQDAGDAMDKLRACTQLAQAEQLECLQKLAHDLAPPPQAASAPAAPEAAADDWIVSETTSPLDYTPIVIASISSAGASGGGALQLSIQCRGGRTDLVIDGRALARRAEDSIVAYAVNGTRPVSVAAAAPISGTGLALKLDVVPLLTSLPERGEITFRVATRQGEAVEGRYALAGLKTVLDRLAGPCRWPTVASVPRNR
ncbi:hypothetical protein [Reyranella sp.]|jgi:hypothetical protein|uniref:hypothetical protein n=1 Tax=Reyranella sp. TaxID=1929291 RepID=UPI002F948A0B